MRHPRPSTGGVSTVTGTGRAQPRRMRNQPKRAGERVAAAIIANSSSVLRMTMVSPDGSGGQLVVAVTTK